MEAFAPSSVMLCFPKSRPRKAAPGLSEVTHVKWLLGTKNKLHEGRRYLHNECLNGGEVGATSALSGCFAASCPGWCSQKLHQNRFVCICGSRLTKINRKTSNTSLSPRFWRCVRLCSVCFPSNRSCRQTVSSFTLRTHLHSRCPRIPNDG